MVYQETYNNVKNGIEHHRFMDLINWIKSGFDIEVLNVIYDETGPDKMPRLNLILKNSKDLKVLIDKVGILDKSKVTAFVEQHYSPSISFNPVNIFVISESFENAVRYKISLKAEALKKAISERHPEIWMVQQMYLNYIIFTYKDSQKESIKQYAEQFHSEFFTELKKFDEFNFLTEADIKIHFDSKERFAKEFSSDWMRYFN